MTRTRPFNIRITSALLPILGIEYSNMILPDDIFLNSFLARRDTTEYSVGTRYHH